MNFTICHYASCGTETWLFDWRQLPGSDELHCLAALFVICRRPRASS